MATDQSTHAYRQFIQSLLARAKLSPATCAEWTDPAAMRVWWRVVTHPTFDAQNNYEVLEFSGDSIIKAIHSKYILNRFANVAVSGFFGQRPEAVLSKIRRHLEARKILSNFAYTLGFWDFVRADTTTRETERAQTLEDVYEAFIGALAQIGDERLGRNMLSAVYCYNFAASMLDTMPLVITKELLDDPITRLNELYKAKTLAGGRPGLEWGNAHFKDTRVYPLKVRALPQINQIGQVYFLEGPSNDLNVKGEPWVYTRCGWVKLTESRFTTFIPMPVTALVEAGEQDPSVQPLWLVVVYSGENWRILGQGMAFEKQDAKKIAAQKALFVLRGRGFYK